MTGLNSSGSRSRSNTRVSILVKDRISGPVPSPFQQTDAEVFHLICNRWLNPLTNAEQDSRSDHRILRRLEPESVLNWHEAGSLGYWQSSWQFQHESG